MSKLNTRDVEEFIAKEQQEATGAELEATKPGLVFNKEARFKGGVETNKTVEGLAAKADSRVYKKGM